MSETWEVSPGTWEGWFTVSRNGVELGHFPHHSPGGALNAAQEAFRFHILPPAIMQSVVAKEFEGIDLGPNAKAALGNIGTMSADAATRYLATELHNVLAELVAESGFDRQDDIRAVLAAVAANGKG